MFDAVLILVGVFGLGVAYFSFRAGGFWVLLGVLALVCEALLVYGSLIEPRTIRVTRYREPLVPQPKTWISIALLTDMHAGSFKDASWFSRMSREVSALRPDVVLFDGDAVVDKADPVMDLASLSDIQSPLGKFFVLGNHDLVDRPQDIRAAFISFGFKDLTNVSVHLEKQGGVVELQGIDDLWYGKPTVVRRSSANTPHVTLSHEADLLLDLKEKQTDLVLSGHTHGGQVYLPILGPLWPVPTFLGRGMCRGRIIKHGVPAIISNGLGESDGRMRLFTPPEIVVVEIGV